MDENWGTSILGNLYLGYLVGGLEHVDDCFSRFTGHCLIPTDELVFFRGFESTNQL